jgi:hypothetical protein
MCAWNLLSTGWCRDAARLLGAVVDFSEEGCSGRQPLEFAARGGCNKSQCELTVDIAIALLGHQAS